MIHKDEQPAAVDKPESEATFVAPAGSLIRWERRSEYRIRGYLVGHPETTLFLIVPANPSGEVHLQGAFVPDDEEAEVWAIRNAQSAAEKYMLDWLATCGREIRDRSKVYGEQIAMMEKNEVEGMNYTGGDPKRALAEKQTEHESQAGEMDFIAAHLVADEQYLLDSQALVCLGIAKSRY